MRRTEKREAKNQHLLMQNFDRKKTRFKLFCYYEDFQSCLQSKNFYLEEGKYGIATAVAKPSVKNCYLI